MTTTRAKPDLHASDQSKKLPVAEVVARLTEILGARLVAYLADVKEQRAVREWAEGKRDFRGAGVERRLRTALHIAGFLAENDGNGTVQAWFQGLNPELEDRVPLKVLREADPNDPSTAEAEVLAAAREFAAR